MIKYDYLKWVDDWRIDKKNAWLAKNPQATSITEAPWTESEVWRDSRHPWMGLMCHLNKQYPALVTKSKAGNGTNVQVGDFKIKSQSGSRITFFVGDYSGSCVEVGYWSIKEFCIDEANKLILINDNIALKYA